ncbi:MAG: tetratricopeptide repeat protein [Pseudomonadota bacterium]
MIRTVFAGVILACAATNAMAVGGDTDAPPKPTETTTVCTDGQIWDERTKTCVSPRESALDDAVLYAAAREFAHAGQLAAAETALAAARNPETSQFLTYRGFVARKRGNWPRAAALYHQALQRDPDNLLARSYYGQGLVAMGERDAAKAQLMEIRRRDGRGTWAYRALQMDLRGGGGGY